MIDQHIIDHFNRRQRPLKEEFKKGCQVRLNYDSKWIGTVVDSTSKFGNNNAIWLRVEWMAIPGEQNTPHDWQIETWLKLV